MLDNESEWPVGEDGLPTRQAARVILFDDDDRVLLVRGHDANDARRSWWFTVGGGLQTGETHRAAAVRECFEETGIRIFADELIGPVIARDSKFYFADRTRRQIEQFFIATVSAKELDFSRWSSDEKNVLDEMAWIPIDQLAELRRKEMIYPKALPDLIVQWRDTGVGTTCVKIDEYND